VDCLPCDPGSYCASPGLASPTGLCSAGYFCTIASPSARPGDDPLPVGYQVIYTAVSVSALGGKCGPGTYCPAGTPIAAPCPAGHYCPSAGMTDVSMQASLCASGSYCELGKPGSAFEAPKSCPAGSYCPAGSAAGIPCPAGTFGAAGGASSLTGCAPCPPGKYCASPGLTEPSGMCAPGYLCQGSERVAAPPDGLCSPGFACPAGATSAIPCDATYSPDAYQDEPGQAACKACPSGFWCSDSSVTKCQPASTQESFFCPAPTPGAARGAMGRDKVPCPEGFINYADASESVDDCEPCPPGSFCPGPNDGIESKTVSCPAGSYCMGATRAPTTCPEGFYCPPETGVPVPCDGGAYCGSTGLAAPTGPCEAGYWCTHVAVDSSAFPFCALIPSCYVGASTARQNACPPGSYCPPGSHTPIGCPIGTFRAAPRAEAVSDCTICGAGAKCPHRGMATEGPLCQAGYYCPPGSAAHVPCAPGTYQPFELSSSCLTCPRGWYCPTTGAQVAKLCPVGFFCPEGTGADVVTMPATFGCPPGYASGSRGRVAAAECPLCTWGKYCAGPGASTYTSSCAAGYACDAAPTSSPNSVASPAGKVCRDGFFCPIGTGVALGCPPGSLGISDVALAAAGSGNTLRTSLGACGACPAGLYCPAYGLGSTEVSGGADPCAYACPAGYICLSGARHPSDLDNNTISLCPPGSFCQSTCGQDSSVAGYFPTGASLCPPGTYQGRAG
jgi:hypothetical protein